MHPLGYGRVQRVLKDICGLTISSGAVVNMAQRAQGAVEQAAEDIRTQIRGAAVVGSDETSARVDGVTYWQWVFQTPEWVYNVIQATRSAQVIADVMDAAQPQVWVSDLFSSQLLNPATDYQICLAHQVRDLQYAIDMQQCQWAEDVQNLLHKSMALNQQRASYAPHAFEKEVRDCESQLDQLLEVYPNNSDGERLRHRFVKHRQAILLFLHRDDVPPTNNASEQALRNSVIYRKVTGGFRSDWGAQLYANVISILETARRQGRDIFQTLVDILHGRIVFPPPVSA